MASIANDPNGTRRILFTNIENERKTIRLGKITKRQAEQVKLRIELLIGAKLTGTAVDDETSLWVASLKDELHEKLAAHGLVTPRAKQAVVTLGTFLRDYTTRRIDVKPATLEVWSQTTRNLLAHFGPERELLTISEGDAEDFKLYLIGEKLAPTTVHKRLQFARMFFRDAVKRKLVAVNPFAEVSAKAVLRPDRQHFVSRADTEKLLAVCDITWRTIIGLARYAGLRTPSETLSLRWQDVDWEHNRITVQSPKTAHHVGKASRTIPIFAELRPILTEAFESAPDGAVYVVGGGYRDAANTPSGWRNCNLRTQFERIILRAGLTPWPRLLHTLRASCETELAAEHPLHVVTQWLGNSPRIAMQHYLSGTQADLDKAIGKGGAESGAPVAQNAAQQASAPIGAESQESKLTPSGLATYAKKSEGVRTSAQTYNGEDRIFFRVVS